MSIDIEKEPPSWADTVRHWMGENDVVLSKQAYRTLIALVGRRTTPQAPTCHHRIADVRNPYIASGYLCVDCGAVFAAADHTAPLPRQAAVQGEWISVEDRLPFPDLDESGNTPMVLVKWRRDSRADNLPDIDVSNAVYLARNVAVATHWMLLPAAPQAAPDQAKSAPAATEKGKA